MGVLSNNLKYLFFLTLFFISKNEDLFGQNINLSNNYSSNVFLNAASYGDGDFESRIKGYYRSQNLSNFNISRDLMFSYDSRFVKQQNEESGYLGYSGQIVSNQIMNGAVQTNYLSTGISYHLFLDDYKEKQISSGIMLSYVESSINKSKMIFSDQYGLEGNLINNVTSEILILSPYSISIKSSLMYTIKDRNSFFQFGSTFYNQSKNSLLQRSQIVQPLNMKYNCFLNYEKEISDYFTYATQFVYAKNDLSEMVLIVGGAIGIPFYDEIENTNRLYLGLNYKFKEAISGNVFLLKERFIFGISYSFFDSNLTNSNIRKISLDLSYSLSLGKKKNVRRLRTIFD